MNSILSASAAAAKLVAAIALLALFGSDAFAADPDFAHDVVPILKQHCAKCHAGTQKKGGLSLNDRAAMLAGGESGPSVNLDRPSESELLARIESTNPDLRMPPEGDPVPPEKIAVLKAWLAGGAKWEEGFTFGKRLYEPPLQPRRPELPAAVAGRENPIDRIVDADLAKRGAPTPAPLDDATFARRVHLDLIGLAPTPEELRAFLDDSRPDKRELLIDRLLARDVDYAEHWLTFWNDLLRNDYTGTGFITGGRTQITKWLYDALVENVPYDEFARQLIAPPTADSRGFIDGIRWRGEVSAGQTVEIQFAQSVAQSFLGLNLKCASCHDSFVDRWTLDEAYGLAAIYSNRPLEIHRCDKPIGKVGRASWLFPEIGQIDPNASQPQRLEQLARLMTHPENGRFTRTIVNRLWHRLLGRGMVHPTDAMQTEPWNADLLDFLAVDLADHGYDLKHTLRLIASSRAYQSRSQVVERGVDDRGYVFAGPRAKRLTAEQFVDAVWRLTESGPTKVDAPIQRGKAVSGGGPAVAPAGRWIWSRADAAQAAAGESVAFKRTIELSEPPLSVASAITADNSYTLWINGRRVESRDDWQTISSPVDASHFKAGNNEILIQAENGGTGPNPAGLYCEIVFHFKTGPARQIGGDAEWRWTAAKPDKNGKFKEEPSDWAPAGVIPRPEVWSSTVGEQIVSRLNTTRVGADLPVRAALVKSDFLMRTLGRPNRDQIVSVRPDELSTLEAIDLSNGETLATTLAAGAKRIAAQKDAAPVAVAERLFVAALGRAPDAEERAELVRLIGSPVDERGVQDVLWMLVLHPEFLIVR